MVGRATTDTLTNKTLTSPTITSPTFTLSTSSSSPDARISWDSTNKKIQVGNGTAVIDFPSGTLVTSAQTGDYTLVLTDKDKLIEFTHNDASTRSLTIPLNSSVAFPIGTQITVLHAGGASAGLVRIIAASGVTINATPQGTTNIANLRARWYSATLIKRGTDTWVVLGDLQS